MIQYLPEYENAFEPTFKDYSNVNISNGKEINLLRAFDEDVFNNRFVGGINPYRYGSYYIYEANNKTK